MFGWSGIFLRSLDPLQGMRARDRRNRSRMKSTGSIAKIRKSRAAYSQAHGPYVVVSVVSLGGGCGDHFDKYLCESNGLFYSAESKTNFLFRATDGLSEFQLGYMCRASDVVVFFIDSAEIDAGKLGMIKKFVPSCLFCISGHDLRDAAKRFVKKHFPEERIVEMGGLEAALGNVRIKNTSVCRRPYLVPSSVYCDGEYVYAEGFLKRGFVSDKVVVNGRHEMTIEEVVADREYKGAELCARADVGDMFCAEPQEMDVECESESLASMPGDGRENEDSDETDSCGGSEDSCGSERESLIDKYAEYRGIRNLSTCDFRSYSFPEHYKGLVFFDDARRAERLVTGQASVIPESQMVRVKLRHRGVLEEPVLVVFGCYEYEDRKTIHNFHFEGTQAVKEEEMVVDLGHRIVCVRPMITRNLNQKVFKRQGELESGVISFIGPISFNMSRVLVYRKSALGELSGSTLVCVGLNGFVGDRIIFDEAVVQGVPFKNKKRYSLVKRMFGSKEEVMYFRNIQLYMRSKKITGFIKKPIGTRGTFKAYFTQPIKSGDKVMMSLYKRVFLESE